MLNLFKVLATVASRSAALVIPFVGIKVASFLLTVSDTSVLLSIVNEKNVNQTTLP